MSPGRAWRTLGDGPVLLSMDCSSHNHPSLPMPGLRSCMPIDGSGTRKTGLLTQVVLDLFADDSRHTLLHEPLAGHPCPLLHPPPHPPPPQPPPLPPLHF